ncbi:MAG: hypothetical protein MUD08_09220 [Cytophagales bacterium]|nr:hypothetical protein [Cytophagales bacterium]
MYDLSKINAPDFDWNVFLQKPHLLKKGMAYNKFMLGEIVEKFDLRIQYEKDIIGDFDSQEPSQWLALLLDKSLPRAARINTEKARSEFIVAPILLEIQEIKEKEISLFSGISFSVDRKNGLSGRCGFLVSFGAETGFLKAPVVTIVKAKNDNVDGQNAPGQCAAEMIAAQIFNHSKEKNIKTIYGATTNGLTWKFLKLIEKNLYIEEVERSFNPDRNMDELIGILLEITKAQN